MKSSKIIIAIEKTLSILSEDDQKTFNYAISNNYYNSCFTIQPLIDLYLDAKQEIKDEYVTKKGGNTLLKKTKLLNKLLKTNWKECFLKTWIEEINGEKRQCAMINGYYAFMFKEGYYIDVENNDLYDPRIDFKLKKCLPSFNSYTEQNYDVADIKTQYTLHKARQSGIPAKKREECTIHVGSQWYKAEQFLNIVRILDDARLFQPQPNFLSVSYFKGTNGDAVLVPVKTPESNI